MMEGNANMSAITEIYGEGLDPNERTGSIEKLTILKPWSANFRACSPDVEYMPVFFLFSPAILKIRSMAVLSSSCMDPSRTGYPILFPKSNGPTNRTSTPGTLAIAST